MIPDNFISPSLEMFPPGWAKRPGHGKMYGKKYIEDYKPILKTLFEIGEQDRSRKMSASRMLQSIEEDPVFRLRLDHPSESEVRGYISGLVQFAKRKRKREEDGPRKSIITDEEEQFILTADLTLKPAAFYDSFNGQFPYSELSAARVKSKFSSMKSKNKK